MADDKRGREKKARDAERSQRRHEVSEALERSAEPEPPDEDMEATDVGLPPECHRRDCSRVATFRVLERYQEETGHGVVEATASLCQEHTAKEHPTNLTAAHEDYVFRIEPLTTQIE